MVSKRIVFFLHLLAISSIFLMMLVTIIETLTVSYNNTNFYTTVPTKQRRLLKNRVTSSKNNAKQIVIKPVVYQVNSGNITQQAAHVNKIIVNSQISIMSTVATEGGDNF
ncbi:MAG: hypothetical protein SOI57_05960 [Leuconostoc gelidum]|jgi:allophanate hydrolase subunit 1|uniref:hypothetical protein n=1 Tax=Leuconostoc gelidum TaxID=1244 RepID=UPI002F35CD42